MRWGQGRESCERQHVTAKAYGVQQLYKGVVLLPERLVGAAGHGTDGVGARRGSGKRQHVMAEADVTQQLNKGAVLLPEHVVDAAGRERSG